jgi:hypothetical protein
MMWLEESKGRNLSQPEAKAGFRSGLMARARQISDMTVQEFFIHEINQKINDVYLTSTSGVQTGYRRPDTHGKWPKKVPGKDSPYRPLAKKPEPMNRVSRLLPEKALIATIINYPELFEEFSEQFGMLSVPNELYDQLRQEVVRFLTHYHDSQENEQISLDHQAVKQHLIESGHAETLKSLEDKSLYERAIFAKPGQPLEKVREGWLDTYSRIRDNGRVKEASADY